MFENAALEVSKTSDQQRAEIGDVVTYRVEVHNPTAGSVNDVIVRDTLPQSFHYAAGTALVTNGNAPAHNVEPEVNDSLLTFHLGPLAAGARASLVYRVRIGVNAREGENVNSAMVEGVLALGEHITTPPAHASIIVGKGIFSTRQIIIGRVFADANGNGMFDAGAVGGADAHDGADRNMSQPSATQAHVIALGQSPDKQTQKTSFVATDNANTPTVSATPLANATPNTPDAAPNRPKLNAPSNKTNEPLAPGTYEVEATEMIAPVVPGVVLLVSPAADEVVKTTALNLEARVAEGWTVAVEVERTRVSDANIGEQRVDHKSKTATYSFVGINLKPGPNHLRVTPISPDGTAGTPIEQTVFGRGPAVRLEVVSDRKELQANGRDAT